jgi:hypothetical protein
MQCRATEQLPEHRFVVIAMVPLPDPFIQIGVEPSLRDRVVGSAHVVFEVPEESFNRVGVDAATDVYTLSVVDAAVAESLLPELAVLDELRPCRPSSGRTNRLMLPRNVVALTSGITIARMSPWRCTMPKIGVLYGSLADATNGPWELRTSSARTSARQQRSSSPRRLRTA